MNAVIYARYSSYNQTERSIEGQIEDCQKYAEFNDINIVGTYIDRAKSGTEAEHRLDFLKMIKDAAKEQFQLVLVYKLDRFSRNRYDSAIYKNKLKQHGVRVVSVMESVSDDPAGIMLESMLEGLAEYYSANLSQNVKRGIRVARERETFTGGHLLYGYTLDGKKIIIDEREAEAVRYLFSEYASGTPMKEIVAELNRRGYKPRTGSKFTTHSFQSALKNRKYIGEVCYDGNVYLNTYPAIIETDLFEAVQRRIDSVRRAPAKTKAKVDYQLSGKLFCGHCGSSIVGVCGRSKTGDVHHYYYCTKRKKQHACDKANEKKDFLEWYVVDQTVKYVLTPKRIDIIAQRLVEQYKNEFSDSNINKLEKMVRSLDREIDDAVDLMLKNKDNDAIQKRLVEKIDELSAQKSDAEIDLVQLRIAAKNAFTFEDYKTWLSSFVGGDPLDEAYRARVIDTFINAVYLYDDKTVVYYNVGDKTEQVSYDDMQSDLSNDDNSEISSDLVLNAPPYLTKSEPLFFINANLFGIVIQREQ